MIKLTMTKLTFPILIAAFLATPIWAAEEPIQFTDLGGVKTWKAGGEATIFVKNKADQWYRADMAETCMKLDTSKGVNFITELDPVTNIKVSKVIVARHICLVTSLKKVDSPDVK